MNDCFKAETRRVFTGLHSKEDSIQIQAAIYLPEPETK